MIILNFLKFASSKIQRRPTQSSLPAPPGVSKKEKAPEMFRSLFLWAVPCPHGGDKRDRTADLLNAIQALSQLSYTPMEVLFTLSGEVSLARCLIIIAELGGFVKKNFRVFLLSRRTPRPPGYMAVYFRNPATICSSACSSVRPRVMSLMIWSPAILPMAASWTRLASTLLAVISGMAWT